jgi:hypothetical protein
MGVRSQEPERIERLRAAHATWLTLVERVLDFSADFFKNMWKATAGEEDRVLVARVLVAFYQKIVADLWAIVVLSERGLPTSALTRDLLESVISVAYITSEHSVERARLCRNYVYEYNRRGLVPDDRIDFVLGSLIDEHTRLKMQSWKGTWAGCSIEEMANRAELPERLKQKIRNFLYAHAAHTLDTDWRNLVQFPPDTAIQTSIPERMEWHLQLATKWQLELACDVTLTALEIIGSNLGVDRQAEIAVLHAEIERLWRTPGGGEALAP